MMYCTVEETRAMMKPDLLDAVIGGGHPVDPDEREALALPLIERAIEDAGAEIDGYLAKNHPVPLTSPPPSIVKIAKDIAAYNIVSRIGIGKEDDRAATYRDRYQAAVKFLEMIARGTVSLGLQTSAKQAASGFRMGGSKRLFSRDSMKGM